MSTIPSAAPEELELGRKRRGGSSTSITQELLLGVAGGLPPALAELVEQLLAESEETAALSVAVPAVSGLRSRARAPRLEAEIRLDPERATACNRCPELARCGGQADGCNWRRCGLECAGCGVRCPVRADLQAWQRDVRGLGLEDLRSEFPPLPQLPPLVPVVDCNELLRWGVTAEWPAWALSLADAHSKRTGAAWSTWTVAGARLQSPVERLRAAGARRLVLTGVMNDQRLAALWPAMARHRLSRGSTWCWLPVGRSTTTIPGCLLLGMEKDPMTRRAVGVPRIRKKLQEDPDIARSTRCPPNQVLS